MMLQGSIYYLSNYALHAPAAKVDCEDGLVHLWRPQFHQNYKDCKDWNQSLGGNRKA